MVVVGNAPAWGAASLHAVSAVDMPDKSADFGFRRVSPEEKGQLVERVFGSVSARYDLMNDLMSWGAHRLWKRFAINVLAPRSAEQVLDVAGGTGDLTRLIERRLQRNGRVLLTDINAAMLRQGRNRLIDNGIAGVACVQASAEALPFVDSEFDAVAIGFGLRNVTDKPKALRSMLRVLKPGGRLIILEFSKPVLPLLQRMYDEYSFKVIPAIGELVARDRDSYQYLVESIRMHPDQQTLKSMMEEAGFARAEYFNLSGGIVAVHRGFNL